MSFTYNAAEKHVICEHFENATSRANENQMTSGPVNAHLTPGHGIYFNAFIHVYSPRAGRGRQPLRDKC